MRPSEVWILAVPDLLYLSVVVPEDAFEIRDEINTAWINLQSDKSSLIFTNSVDCVDPIRDVRIFFWYQHFDRDVVTPHLLQDDPVIRLSSLSSSSLTCRVTIDVDLSIVVGEIQTEQLDHLRNGS